MLLIQKQFYSLLIFADILFLSSCYGSRQIAIDENLALHSQSVVPHTKNGVLKIGQTSFDNFYTIESRKLDSAKINNRSKEPGIIYKTITTETTKHYRLVISNGQDTSTTVFSIRSTEVRDDPTLLNNLFSKKDKPSKTLAQNKFSEGTIFLHGKKMSWNFEVGPYQLEFKHDNDRVAETTGFIHNVSDGLTITPVAMLTKPKKTDSYTMIYSKGIEVKRSGDVVAALQLVGKQSIWIRNDIPADYKLLIASVFSVILSTPI